MAATLAGNAAQPTRSRRPPRRPRPPLPPRRRRCRSRQWFIGVNGQQQGPFDAAALAAQVAGGGLTRETLVWKTGMAGWVPAGQVPGARGAARRGPAAAAPAVTAFPARFRSVQIRSVQRSPG